ncbi:glycosyltransferase family 2 protein [Empedobacter tilapiae]|nr:glycosyltransferase family A protein [Empedobacter tilapiae]
MENKVSPLVSIIIPTYNRADLIGETLDSIIGQTYQNWECIVVDDGSTDHTEEILSSYIKKDNRISYHKRPSVYKSGGNGARNYGFDISKGEYINWFDSDDVMVDTFVSDKINNIKNNDIIICSHFTVNSELEIIKRYDIVIENNILYDYMIWGENFNVLTPSILFKKEFLVKGSFKFNEKILRGQEAEFLINIFSKTINILKFEIINKPLFYYRQHSNTKTFEYNKQLNKFNYSLLYTFFQKYFISKEFNFLLLKNDTLFHLKNLSIKVIKEREFKNLLFICEQLLKIRTPEAILLSSSLIGLFLIDKTPKIILNKWEKL